ncbi:MAG: hypothetical protein JW795_23145 [Chitinivibrionales bacterium]|nr:hypothetical protein [Chitinivibrionales bacterium]
MPISEYKKAEKFLNIKLPKTCSEVKYFKQQPNPNLDLYHLFISMNAYEEDFRAIVGDMQLKLYGKDASIAGFLPSAWNGPSNESLPWWTPTGETPPGAAAKPFGINGWIIAKYENSHIYIYATDSGNKEGTPGPW